MSLDVLVIKKKREELSPRNRNKSRNRSNEFTTDECHYGGLKCHSWKLEKENKIDIDK